MSDQKTLKDILEEIKVKSEDVITQAGELQKSGNFAKELAEVSIAGFDQSPLNDHPTIYIGDFQSVLNGLGKIEAHLGTMSSLASGLTYGTVSAMTTLSGTLTPHNYRSNPSYVQFYSQFDQVVDRGQTKDQAVAGMQRLGLNSTTEGKEAIKLLTSAWDLHIQGAGISTSTLIPLRESIAKTLLAILRKSSSPQSKLKKRIVDLGAKVALTHVSSSDLQTLQAEHEFMRDKLSGSKSGTYSKEEERTLIREGTLHLLKILTMVDPDKLVRLKTMHRRR